MKICDLSLFVQELRDCVFTSESNNDRTSSRDSVMQRGVLFK
jgi:hypothetical protein